MLIPPKYFLTPKISQLLAGIEACKEVINTISIPPEVETNIRRQSTLRSSLFSARIEGNPLTLDELATKSSRDQKKIEVFNILKAQNLIYQKRGKDLSQNDLMELHGVVLNGLTESYNLGKFRNEVSAIFNSAGIAIYLPPPPRQIPHLIEKLIKFINSQKEPFIPIRASLTHFMFEKIHPFLDGNGRVGRLLTSAVLQKQGFGMKGLLNIEEYLDTHRPIYYRVLEESEKDVTSFVEFMLEAILQSSQIIKKLILTKKDTKREDFLLPRRQEILNIIKDQRLVSFDQIRRRFMGVNERTLRYDLKKLQDSGFIRKRGATKGVYYEAI
ncbi:Fic family protein [Candidatus Roizmanbacteria bacterium]|nr:Fic family protein [Candidatus Roizmanbacteria bacterium]